MLISDDDVCRILRFATEFARMFYDPTNECNSVCSICLTDIHVHLHLHLPDDYFGRYKQLFIPFKCGWTKICPRDHFTDAVKF